ncbi:MAG TPA: electron transport complex subunit E [Candidatus Omnitrophica bacterium]|nr:electron transport complex subunit E [Candidatus Omnitrophota bacterium]
MDKNLFEFKKGFLRQNPVLVQLLGLCPALAVTTSAVNALTMGLAVIFVLLSSTFIVSLIKRLVPSQVRIAVFTVIIATFVTIADLFLKAWFPEISKSLGPYVPLIVVNCIILGRCEAFASKSSIFKTILDSFGMGLGFTFALLILGSFREILGSGTIFNIGILPQSYQPMLIMILPAGAFLGLGIMVGFMNFFVNKKS